MSRILDEKSWYLIVIESFEFGSCMLIDQCAALSALLWVCICCFCWSKGNSVCQIKETCFIINLVM